MYDVLRQAHDLALTYLSSLPQRNVAPTASLEELRRAFRTPLPDQGEDASSVIGSLVDAADPGIMANAGGRFFGFVIGGALPVSVAADWMTSSWDQNPGIYALSPAEAVIEEAAIDWLLDLLGLPSSASAGFVTGAQMANFTGLAAARYEVLRRTGWDVNTDGLQGAPLLNVVVGEEVHITVLRALRYLGIGTARARVAAADGQGRMIPVELERILNDHEGPTIVCAQAGNVHTGAIDPMQEIAAIAHEHGAWLHVDGAFGLWAGAVPQMRHLLRGIELADSWATDAHKWLNVPQDCGVVIVADPAAHKAAVSTDAAYLIKAAGAERDAVDFVPEFSRRGRGFPVYAALRHLGRSGVADLVERCCRHARTMAERIGEHPNAEVLNDVTLNQVLVQFQSPAADADELTRAVVQRVQKDGTCWLGGSVWKGRTVMRISVSNWSTSADDVDQSIAAILRCLDAELEARSAVEAAGNLPPMG
jgi:glutamate/tyrosine decarboxylase-like PLP-dependent enzyme